MFDEKDLSTIKTFRRLWPFITPYKLGLIVAAIALIMNALTDTTLLSLLKPLINDGFSANSHQVLLKMPFILLALVLARGLASYASNYCLSWVSGKVVMQMRQKLFANLMNMP